MIGRGLGHYRIDSKLGEGGMGIVYKARDTHLDRFVAIKILTAEAASNPERRRRFMQEAKAASALNHPNILQVYDIEAAGDVDFIAMEYVEGHTLHDLIGRKGLPLRETLKCAVQLADALAAAHAAGIVHRDIKPGNVMVNHTGRVKILDFGLAKLTERAEGGDFGSTQTMQPRTEEGMIVGTVAYMSPEQAEGKKIDSRSDIFSFGSVLYEMVTGVRAFQGQTKVSLLSAILHEEPKPLSDSAAPRELERIITRCLRKDPSRRFQHMDDVKVLLEELKEESESGRVSAALLAEAAPPRRRWRHAAMPAAVVLTLAAVAATWWFMQRGRQAEEPAVMPIMQLTSDTGLTTDPALSPDGKLVAYASDRAGENNLDIWVQQIDGGAPLRLTSDASDEYEPSFSPDGNRIVFRSERDGGGIYTIPALGGEPRLIAKGGRNARYSPEGTGIAFVTGKGGYGGVALAALFVIPSLGGPPKQLVPADIGAAYPVWSPDGQWILFALGGYRIDEWAVVRADFAQPVRPGQFDFDSAVRERPGAPLAIVKLDALRKSGLGEPTPHQWLPGNRIVFSAKSGDTSHVFEIGLSHLAATAWRLDSSVRRLTFGTDFDQGASIANAGTAPGVNRMAFASLNRKENLWSLALDADHPRPGGKLQQLTRESGFHIFPSVSLDGTRLAFISHTAYNDEVWFVDLKTGKKSLLTTTRSVKYKARITPDGLQVFYGDAGSPVGNYFGKGVYAVSVSGGARNALCEQCGGWAWDWSPDHRWLLFWSKGKSSVTAAIQDLQIEKSTMFLEHPPTDVYELRWSPDGRWVVFVTRNVQEGRSRVYVAPFSGDHGPNENTWIPITESTWEDKLDWSPSGNWIYSLSDRDGYFCIWAYPLDVQTKKPDGAPVAVFHSHRAALSLRDANLVSQELSIARDKIVFNLGEITGNIWMTELQEKK